MVQERNIRVDSLDGYIAGLRFSPQLHERFNKYKRAAQAWFARNLAPTLAEQFKMAA